MDALTADISYLTMQVRIYRQLRYLGWVSLYIERMRGMDKTARPSLLARVRQLPERRAAFEEGMHARIDEIEERAEKSESLASQAAEKHLAYYDGLISEFEESFQAAEELANSVPLGGGNANGASNNGPPPLPIEPPASSNASVSNGVTTARPAFGGSRT